MIQTNEQSITDTIKKLQIQVDEVENMQSGQDKSPETTPLRAPQ